MRKEKFVPGEYYHIYNRVIMNAPEFKDKSAAERLRRAFLLANSSKSSEIFQSLRNNDAKFGDISKMLKKDEKLVDILCYVIMPNHYHLLLRENKENGIINFVRKCDISISKYINIKKQRKGPLFESRFKSKLVNTNEYLLHLSTYIHLNPLDFLSGKEWRIHKLKKWTDIKDGIINYPWSSLKAFLRYQEDKILSGTDVILEQFKNKDGYENFLRNWSQESFNLIECLIVD